MLGSSRGYVLFFLLKLDLYVAPFNIAISRSGSPKRGHCRRGNFLTLSKKRVLFSYLALSYSRAYTLYGFSLRRGSGAAVGP